MFVHEFVKMFVDGKVANNKFEPNAVENFIRKNLDIKEYIPFNEKRMIAEMVVRANTVDVNGVKKHDSINAYVGFVVAMLGAHTALQFGEDPVADYDLLAENGLLMPVIETFRADYTECDVILKMALAHEMEDNSVGAVVGRFLNGVSNTIDGIGDSLKKKIDEVNIDDILGDVKQEDMTKLFGLLDKLK